MGGWGCITGPWVPGPNCTVEPQSRPPLGPRSGPDRRPRSGPDCSLGRDCTIRSDDWALIAPSGPDHALIDDWAPIAPSGLDPDYDCSVGPRLGCDCAVRPDPTQAAPSGPPIALRPRSGLGSGPDRAPIAPSGPDRAPDCTVVRRRAPIGPRLRRRAPISCAL